MYKLILIILFPFIFLGQDRGAEYYYRFALDSLKDKDNRLALEFISKAIELDSLNPKYYASRATFYDKIGFDRKSVNDYMKSFKLDSLNSERYYDLIEQMFFSGFNSEELSAEIENALKVFPNNKKLINHKITFFANWDIYNFPSNAYEFIDHYEFNNEELKLYAESRVDYWVNEYKNLPRLKNKKYIGFYPHTGMSSKDTLNYPIKFELSINVDDIYNFKNENDFFDINFNINVFTDYPPEYVTKIIDQDIPDYSKTDTIRIADPRNSFYVNSFQNEDNSLTAYRIYLDKDYNFLDDRSQKYHYSTKFKLAKFSHLVDLRDYPFDKQKLVIQTEFSLDTSIVKLYENKLFENSFSKKMTGLKSGLKIEKINFIQSYKEDDNVIISASEFPNGRTMVKPLGVFEIIISRKGSLLFIKLFLGTFLAVLMSLSTFYINKKNFGSRIDVSVGALFICVGNKYFVESVTPIAQVLTKADIINNFSLLLIIANVLLVIGQHKPEIKLGKFEDSKYALKFSSISFLVVLFLTIIV